MKIIFLHFFQNKVFKCYVFNSIYKNNIIVTWKALLYYLVHYDNNILMEFLNKINFLF